MSTTSLSVPSEPARASHPAMLAFVREEDVHIKEITGGAIARIVLLAGLDARLRDDDELIAVVESTAPELRSRLLRRVLRAAGQEQRILVARLARLEIHHRAVYDLGVDRSGDRRSDAERDGARARYATLYPRMVVAVAWAVLDGALTSADVLKALIDGRWPAGLAYSPWREGDRDLLDEVRGRHVQTSIDEHLQALDRDDGRPDMRVVAKLATTRDVATELVAREELGGRLGIVLAEYASFKDDIATASRRQTQRLLELLLLDGESAQVVEQLEAEGFRKVEANSADQAWKRALAPYDLLSDVLSRRRPDFADVVHDLDHLHQAVSRTTGRPSTTVR